MTKKSLLFLVFTFLMCSLTWATTPTTTVNKLNAPQVEQKIELNTVDAIQLTSSTEEMPKIDTKKMSFKEKMATKLLQKKVAKFEKKQAKRAKKGKSTKDISDISLSGLFVLIGLILIVVGILALAGIILSTTAGGGTVVLGLILVLI